MRGTAAFGDDVDDGADGVGAKQRALGAANDLDAIDVGDREMCEIVAASKRVRADPIDEHERVVGSAASWEERRNRAAPAAARYGEARDEPQRIRNRLDLARTKFG